jgi:hypothetical protein
MENHKISCLLGWRAAGRGVGQVDISQCDPVCQGHFLGHDQDEVATSETLDGGWNKGRTKR